MSAATHLAQYGISVEVAREYILANISDPAHLHATFLQFEVDAAMVAEIYGGVSANDVVNFFNALGLDGEALREVGDGTTKDSPDLVLDESDDKISIGATDYASFIDSSADMLTDLDTFRDDSRFSSIDGSGQTVVVIDTAFDLDHSFFGADTDQNGVSDRIIYHEDFTSERDGANTSNPDENHGTHVASIVASSDPNHPGVAPGTNLVVLQVLAADGFGSAVWIQKALQWVVANAAEYNVVAVNMSLGDSSNNTSETSGWATDEMRQLAAMDIMTVVAAGNDYIEFKSEGVSYPGSDPYAFTVSAINASSSPDQLADFSQRSDSLTDILAPGVDITHGDVGGGVVSLSGTSMAAPYISGVIALAQQIAVNSMGRKLTLNELTNLLRSSSASVVDSETPSDGVPNTGDTYHRIDVHALGESILAMSGSDDANSDDDVSGEPDNDVPGNTLTTASLEVNGSVEGDLEETGDSDWFSITLSAGASYTFSLEGNTLSDPYLRVYDSSGAQLAYNDDSDEGGTFDSELDFVPSESGTYYLSAGSYQGGGRGTYTLSAVQGAVQDEEPDTGGNDGNGTFTGSIDFSGDTDRFEVTLTAGVMYEFALEGSSVDKGTLSDPVIKLFDSNDNLVGSDDDGGGNYNSLLEYRPESTGTYYVTASGFGSAVGTYTLTMSSAETGDQIGDNAASAGSISADQSITGTIDFADDADWYAISLSAGVQYTIDLEGSPTERGTLSDTFLSVYNADGQLVDSNDDGGTGYNSNLVLSPDAAGTYYISAQAYGDNTGTYLLSVAAGDADVPGGVSSDEIITSGGVVSGSVDVSQDEDWYAIALEAGQQYLFDLKGAESGVGTLSDPYLRLYDASGVQLDYDDDDGAGYESSLSYTASSSGTYYISAGGYGSSTGSYQLSASGVQSVSINTSGELAGGTDEDTYSVDLTAGVSYVVNVYGSSSNQGSLADPVVTVTSSGGSVYSNDDGGTGLDSQLYFSAAESGSHVITVGTYDSGAGSYVLSFELA